MLLTSLDTETNTAAASYVSPDGVVSATPPGLDARVAEILSAAWGANGKHDGDYWLSAYDSEPEDVLLRRLAGMFDHCVRTGAVVVTWNGVGFDIPYIALRSALAGDPIITGFDPFIEGVDVVPKYGWPEWANLVHPDGRWGQGFTVAAGRVRHVDIAPLFQARAAELGVKHSLKPVAEAVLGHTPVVVDASQVHLLSEAERRSYVASDAQVTLALALRLVEEQHPAFEAATR